MVAASKGGTSLYGSGENRFIQIWGFEELRCFGFRAHHFLLFNYLHQEFQECWTSIAMLLMLGKDAGYFANMEELVRNVLRAEALEASYFTGREDVEEPRAWHGNGQMVGESTPHSQGSQGRENVEK
jgi:hypothetical protein